MHVQQIGPAATRKDWEIGIIGAATPEEHLRLLRRVFADKSTETWCGFFDAKKHSDKVFMERTTSGSVLAAVVSMLRGSGKPINPKVRTVTDKLGLTREEIGELFGPEEKGPRVSGAIMTQRIETLLADEYA
jgi:hypothetical protein